MAHPPSHNSTQPRFFVGHDDRGSYDCSQVQDAKSPSRPVSVLLFDELDNLCSMLRDLDAKLNGRLAPIMRDPPAAEPSEPTLCSGNFSPLFDGLFAGITGAQSLVRRINDSLDRVDEL